MEIVLLTLVVLSPWAYGAIHPGFEFLLDAGIAVLLLLWAARMLLEGQITWKKSSVAFCLAGLFLLGIWQRTPLSRPLLARLSPTTTHYYAQLLPEQSETVADEEPLLQDVSRPPGSTLSFYPGATRRETTRLLAVLLVFAVVLNNLTSKGVLLRFSTALLVNGVLLSLFALVQFFSAPLNNVYWYYPTRGNVFGPFINHNHFPDYVNLCIGAGIGLLVYLENRDWRRNGHASSFVYAPPGPLMQTLHNPLALGICAALGLMVSAVAFSRSRGGILALLGAAVICTVLGRIRLGRSFRLGPILLAAGVVVALSAWFGIDLVKQRLDTLATGEAYTSRLPLWLRSLPIVADFPLWGTGYGTFGYVEPMYRTAASLEESPIWYSHAHNDYLEILVEGGALGLSLALLMLAFVFRRGYLALAIHRGRSKGGLALGALFGFTALALHGFSEFGAHVPAIALAAIVICAHLCALGQSSSARSNSTDEDSDEYRLRVGGIAPLLAALVVLGLALTLCVSGWKAQRVDRLRNAAFQESNAGVEQLHSGIAYLTEAVSLVGDDAQLHYDLGDAHAQLANDSRAEAERALREYLRARDACPLLNKAHLRIAGYADRLKRGDSAKDYLRRVKFLAPQEAGLWYLCGWRELLLGHRDDAWATWRHCLELSSEYLAPILNQSSAIPDGQLMDKILPDSPALLLATVLQLDPNNEDLSRRRPFLDKALHLLDRQTEQLEPSQLHVRARIYKALDQPEQAVEDYRQLLKRAPSQTDWRFEFARYLYDLDRLKEASRQLRVVLAQDAQHVAARDLFRVVEHERQSEEEEERK